MHDLDAGSRCSLPLIGEIHFREICMIFDMSDKTHVGDGERDRPTCARDGISYQVFGTTFSGGCTNQSRLNFYGVVQVILLK